MSQDRVKLRAVYFVCTFIWWIRKKSWKIFGKVVVGIVRESWKFSGHPYSLWGALRGHLCDSTAFLSQVPNAGILLYTYIIKQGWKLFWNGEGVTEVTGQLTHCSIAVPIPKVCLQFMPSVPDVGGPIRRIKLQDTRHFGLLGMLLNE